MQPTSLTCNPIGYFHTIEKDRYHLPKQSGLGKKNEGMIALNPHQNFEQALTDLIGFSHIWVLFWFHGNFNWKPKIMTPLGPPKRGLFATRSPHRPNPIGLSCLEIVDIKGLHIRVAEHDLLDKTPILDIKPYIEYADSKTGTRQGWLENYKQSNFYQIKWSDLSIIQIAYLENDWNLDLKNPITFRLMTNPFPSSNNRIELIQNHFYRLSYKTWRIIFSIKEDEIEIVKIDTGYDDETLLNLKTSRWDDVHIHQEFLRKFNS